MFAAEPFFTGYHLTAELKSKWHSLTAMAILHGSILFGAPISFIYFCFTPFPYSGTTRHVLLKSKLRNHKSIQE